MLSALCTGPGTIELRDLPKPDPGPGEVLLRVRRCGICGSDLHYWAGGFPPPPVCPGHEISGEVAEVGRGVSGWRPGDRVAVEPLRVCGACEFCRAGDYQLCRDLRILGNMEEGGFAEFLRAPATALFRLPDEVDFEVGALAEPLAVAVHGVRLGGVRLGDRVLVQGAGTIGLMAVAAARAAGAAEVWITARHPQQAAAATSLGATRVFTGSGAGEELAAAADGAAPDVVVETVGGTADTLMEAIQVVRRGGTIVVLGLFAGLPSIQPLLFVVREIRMVGAMTYGRAGVRADFDIALGLLARQPEIFRSLVTHRIPLRDLAGGFRVAADKGSGSIKVSVAADV